VWGVPLNDDDGDDNDDDACARGKIVKMHRWALTHAFAERPLVKCVYSGCRLN
jgi:hypothetical protein